MNSNNTRPQSRTEQASSNGRDNDRISSPTIDTESDTTMSTLMADQCAAPDDLTQFFDDIERFTMWDVGEVAEILPTISSVHTSADYSDISAGIAPERLVLTRDDEARLQLVFTVDLEFLPNGDVDEETITGWKWRTDGDWNTESANGSLEGLCQLIDTWAAESVKSNDDDLPVLSRILVDREGARYRVYWKPLRFLRSDGSVESTWDTEVFSPAHWADDPFEDRIIGGVHFGSEGGAYTSQRVDSIEDLTSGNYTVVKEEG